MTSPSGPMCVAAPSRARASSSSRPVRGSRGSPAKPDDAPASRVAKTIAIRSADTRRATNTSTRREASSIHWASSTTQQTGVSFATSCSSPRTARPTVSGSGEVCAPRPNTASRALRCTAGSPRRWSRTGAHSWCSVA